MVFYIATDDNYVMSVSQLLSFVKLTTLSPSWKFLDLVLMLYMFHVSFIHVYMLFIYKEYDKFS